MTRIVGYDVGGAHLKVAVAEDGRLTAVRQIVCPLWRGVEHLEAALAEAAVITAGVITAGACEHRVTMTGELADVFPDRYTGVCRIVETVAARLGPDVRFWMGPLQALGTADEAMADHLGVASTNFLATAAFVARALPGCDGLLIDMGSTTTDIVPFVNGVACPIATSDAGRLVSGELVYTGLTRTPVTAVTRDGIYAGQRQSLTGDSFATMADVYRLLQRLPEHVDLYGTADGRGVTNGESCARLARCYGHDFAPGEDAAWRVAAAHVADQQLRAILDGAFQVLSRAPTCATLVVAAGIGAGVVVEVARRIGSKVRPFAQVAGIPRDAPMELAVAAGYHAPAVALALM